MSRRAGLAGDAGMARQRVYRKARQCPRCGSNWLPKYGRSLGKQTCRCGQCLYHFTEGAPRPHPAPEVKSRVLALYTEGMSLASIGRVEGLKGATVYGLVQKSPGRRGFDAPLGAGKSSRSPEAGPGHRPG